MNRQLLITKPGTITAEDKVKLAEAGHVLIEHTNPEQIVRINEPVNLPYVYVNCYKCGERIYMLQEKLDAYKKNSETFYCINGHGTLYSNKK